MRTFSILMIVFLAAGCEKIKEGQDCSGLTDSCEEGFRCVDNVCTDCGAQGAVCCSIPAGPEVCDEPGTACSGGEFGYGVCDGDCGQIGLPCCGNDCFNGTCNLGECIDDGGGDDCHNPSGEPHKVFVIDAGCNSVIVNFQTTTPEKAEECRQALLADNVDVCPLDGAPQSKHFCGYSQFPPANSPTFEFCNEAWLDTCKETACDNCNWEEKPAPCE